METRVGSNGAPSRVLGYVFRGDYPTPETVARAYDDADLGRAVEAYKFFYPTVSGLAMYKGNVDAGLVENQTFGVLESTRPHHFMLTASSDTPYGPILLDLGQGPMVVELPPGPLIASATDINQRWVADMGLPGPDGGAGGKHVLLPPGYQGGVPPGHHVWQSTTTHLLVGVRSLPVDGDLHAAVERIKAVKVRPLQPRAGWTEPRWIDLTERIEDTTPLNFEITLRFWEVLHEELNTEPPYEPYRTQYGELAVLGIVRGKPFAPDARMRRILQHGAEIANAQMRVEAFADRRPERIVWPDRQWEWVALREDGDFNAAEHADLDARDKWFFQAIGASPAMFRRSVGAGSVAWLGLRDASGAYLDGDTSYRLRVPLPVPATLFWSVTAYDAETRCEMFTGQGKAALRSLFELKHHLAARGRAVDLRFGPTPPADPVERDTQWIETLPGKGWFAYFRIYGPEPAAFDGGWRPGDFERI
jgi:hypothetical protein